jgi:hypothetical protein
VRQTSEERLGEYDDVEICQYDDWNTVAGTNKQQEFPALTNLLLFFSEHRKTDSVL